MKTINLPEGCAHRRAHRQEGEMDGLLGMGCLSEVTQHSLPGRTGCIFGSLELCLQWDWESHSHNFGCLSSNSARLNGLQNGAFQLHTQSCPGTSPLWQVWRGSLGSFSLHQAMDSIHDVGYNPVGPGKWPVQKSLFPTPVPEPI